MMNRRGGTHSYVVPPSSFESQMPNFYISFGQGHTHRVDGKTYDCDALYKIEAEDSMAGRRAAFAVFDAKWSSIYDEEEMLKSIHYYPRGVLNAQAHSS